MKWVYLQTVLPLALVAFIVWWTWPKKRDEDQVGHDGNIGGNEKSSGNDDAAD